MSNPTPWAHVRAGLIAVAIGLNALTATPNPQRLNERSLSRPAAMEELDGWMSVIDTLGLDLSRERLRELAIDGVNAYVTVRHAVITKPSRTLRRWFGIRQNWALFARPDTYPTTLVIDVREAPGAWQTAFRSLDPEHDALEPQLRYRRIRGLYDVGERPAAPYTNLCAWAAGQLFDDRPEIEAVRCRLIERHTVRPGEPEDPTQRVIGERIHEREAP